MVARVPWLRRFRYDESLLRAEDRALWCRTALSSRIDALEEVLYLIRVIPRAPSFLEDYRRGQADLRRVLMRYGPALAGPLPTARMFCASVLKSAAMTAASRLGGSQAIVRRRGRPATAAELARVDEALAAARPKA
jgi:hypothetical protein